MALWSSQLNRPGFEPRLLTCKRVREIYIPGNHPSPPDLTPVLCDVSRRKRKISRLLPPLDPNSNGFVSIIFLFVKWVDVQLDVEVDETVGRPS